MDSYMRWQVVGMTLALFLILGLFSLCEADLAGTTYVTPITVKGPYESTIAEDDLDITWTAATGSDLWLFPITGGEIILIRNTSGASTHDITLCSVADEYGRKGDIVYTLGVNEILAFRINNTRGWRVSGGVYDASMVVSASSTDLEIAVLKYK